jgi:hypothetical protein
MLSYALVNTNSAVLSNENFKKLYFVMEILLPTVHIRYNILSFKFNCRSLIKIEV